MPKDHYVAQVYLKGFVHSDDSLFPYYKGKKVIVGKPQSRSSVCFQDDWNTNSMLSTPRIVEDFIAPVENNWEKNVSDIINRRYNQNTIYEVASYLSFLRTLTPTAIRKRMFSEANHIATLAKHLASNGEFYNEKFSPEFNREMTNLVINDGVNITIESDYAKGKNFEICLRLIHSLCAGDWLILHASPWSFLTSDNPIALHFPRNNRVGLCFWYVPIRHDLCLLINMNTDFSYEVNQQMKDKNFDFSEIHFGNISHGKIKSKNLFEYNRLTVRNAEESIFFHEKADWVEKMVRENQNWFPQAAVDYLPTDNGYCMILRDRVSQK